MFKILLVMCLFSVLSVASAKEKISAPREPAQFGGRGCGAIAHQLSQMANAQVDVQAKKAFFVAQQSTELACELGAASNSSALLYSLRVENEGKNIALRVKINQPDLPFFSQDPIRSIELLGPGNVRGTSSSSSAGEFFLEMGPEVRGDLNQRGAWRAVIVAQSGRAVSFWVTCSNAEGRPCVR